MWYVGDGARCNEEEKVQSVRGFDESIVLAY